MSPTTARNIVLLKLAEILPSPLNPRRFSHAQLTEEELRPLGESLRSGGQWELITVRPHATEPGKYELVNGERRWRAAQLAGVKHLEARVEDFTDAQAMDMMLATGGQDEPLSAMALAHGYAERLALEGITQGELAKKLGVGKDEIGRHLALLDLPAELQTAVDEGRLPMITAYVVAMVPGEKERAAFGQEVLHPVTQDHPLTKRTAEALRAAKYARSLKGAPFDVKDAKLVAEAGACTGCPWLAGNNPEAYGDLVKSAQHTCMKPACFEQKVAAVRERIAAKLVATDGVLPLTPEENALAYPHGQAGLNPKALLVEWSKPVPADLLKPEVVAEGAPHWEDLCDGDRLIKVQAPSGRLDDDGKAIYEEREVAAAKVTVRLGFDQDNRPVRLVRVSEAVVAAAAQEPAIFNEETRVRYGLARAPSRGAKADRGNAKGRKDDTEESEASAGNEPVPFTAELAEQLEQDARVIALKAEVGALVDMLALVAVETWKELSAPRRIEVETYLGRHGVDIKERLPKRKARRKAK